MTVEVVRRGVGRAAAWDTNEFSDAVRGDWLWYYESAAGWSADGWSVVTTSGVWYGFPTPEEALYDAPEGPGRG